MPRKSKGEKTNLTLLEEYRKGSIEARDELIDFFMVNASQISKRYYNLGLSEEDILQSAYEGVIVGINKSRDVKCKNVSVEVMYYIKRTIELNILANYGIYLEKTGVFIISEIIEVLKAKRDIKSDNVVNISNYLGKNVNRVQEILNFISCKDYNYLEKNYNFLGLEDSYLRKEMFQEINNLLKENLSDNQMKVFYLRCYLGLSLRKAAKIMNITYQRCKQIEDIVIKKLNKISKFIKDKGENKKNFSLMKISEVFLLYMNGDVLAFDYLVDYYLSKIMNIIEKYSDYNHSKEELVSIACSGIKLALRNNYQYNNMLNIVQNSIASSIIYRYGTQFVKNFNYEGKIRVFNMLRAKEDFINRYGYFPSNNELSVYMNCDIEDIISMRKLIK